MILLKQKRFSEFIDAIEEISAKTLSVRLKEMGEAGLVDRIVVSSRPVQTEYIVTDKGMMIEPILELS
jgi:DNA-binding HxlR family transcriptional regulator